MQKSQKNLVLSILVYLIIKMPNQNYNNALSKTSAPLVATFDADMIPYREFLMEAVPYFIEQVEAYERGEEINQKLLDSNSTKFYNADIFQYNLFSEETFLITRFLFKRNQCFQQCAWCSGLHRFKHGYFPQGY